MCQFVNEYSGRTDIHGELFFDAEAAVIRKTAPPPWWPYINKTNLFKFHDDYAKNVTSSVHKRFYYINIRKNAPFPGGHVFQRTRFIFKLNSLLTCFHYIHIEKTAPPTSGHVFSPIWTFQKRKLPRPPGSHVFQRTGTISKLNSHWTKNVTSRVFTSKTAPPTGGHVFSPILTIIQLVRDINKTNAKLVTSRVQIRKTAQPTGGHVFQWTGTTFKLNQHIIKTNILTNFKLERDIIGTKLLTKFHGDPTRNVASRVFTNKCGRTEDGQRPITKAHLSNQVQKIDLFCAAQDIIKINVLTNFHDDRTINVASRV
ncbi:hypothetical protein DPMN_171248 [Dreissena polymorpha]|uniref:Uncharacterized protein n=1 Tax=Dreissena polymorpha TaxID=45954 RepID=A0A9D4IDZ9_DREPO|nr:hypothetical protein DPMN_171248 [Dreissena polymorpha]